MEIKKLFQKIRVLLSFIVGAIFLIFSRPDEIHFMVGVPIALLGVLLRIWASGHIVKSKKLTKSGPYKYTRNPLYLGSFFIGLGISIQCGRIIFPILLLILFLFIYIPVMKREEEEMEMVFGRDYLEYKKLVSFFIPIPNKKIEDKGKFNIDQVIKNREYKGVIGFILVELILMVKFFL